MAAGRRIWQLHVSTWCILLLACVPLLLLIVPGEFSDNADFPEALAMGPHRFEHGWPWVYLTRRIAFDDKLVQQIEIAIQASAPPPVRLPHHGIPWVQGWAWSFHGDLADEPEWVHGGPQTWDLRALALDVLVACLILFSLAAALEWRRRRRKLWQFSLAETTALTLVLSAVLAWWLARTQRTHQEREIAKANKRGLFVFESCGPVWLRRTIGTSRLNHQQRIVGVHTHKSSEDEVLRIIECANGLPHLQWLVIPSKLPTDGALLRLEKLTQVKEIVLVGLRTQADFAHLGKLRTLESLTLNECTDMVPGALEPLSKLTNLQELRIRGSGVDGRGLKFLSHVDRLKLLDLTDTAVDDAGLPVIGRLHGLQHLGLANTKIRGDGLIHLSNLQQLLTLSLQGTGVGDKDLKHLRGLRSLKRIVLRDSQVTVVGRKELQELLPRCDIRD